MDGRGDALHLIRAASSKRRRSSRGRFPTSAPPAGRCSSRSLGSRTSCRSCSARSGRARGSRSACRAAAGRACCRWPSWRSCATSWPRRVQHARRALSDRTYSEEQHRRLIEEMLLDPAAHKWVRVSNEDIGEPGCKHWHVRPRWGLIGMLMGWWRVVISSGCPLAT